MGAWGPAETSHVPLEWWGPFGARGPALSVVDLVAGGVLTAAQAALLWTAVEHGTSLCMVAGPSGAGKTTTLTSLFEAIPAARRRVFVRGMYETFAFRRDLRPGEAVLLVNEISPHLPIYCWGDAVRGLLQSGRDGYQILATMHATSPPEVVRTLAARPLRLPLPLVAQLGLVAFINAWREPDGRICRRLREIVALGYDDAKQAITVTPAEETEFARLHASSIASRDEIVALLAARPARPSPAALREALGSAR